MLAEYSSSINPEHEQARACARTPKPEHHKKDRAPSEHVLGPIPTVKHTLADGKFWDMCLP